MRKFLLSIKSKLLLLGIGGLCLGLAIFFFFSTQAQFANPILESETFLPLVINNHNLSETDPESNESPEEVAPEPIELGEEHGDEYWSLLTENDAPWVPPVTGRADLAANIGGQWGEVMTWPHTPVSIANLPDGRLLTWSGSQPEHWPAAEQTYAATYDPASGAIDPYFNDNHNVFCSELLSLNDGRVFAIGGRNVTEKTSTFDPISNSWSVEDDMDYGRWYPTAVTMPDDSVFVAVGLADRYPELWQAGLGWQTLTGIDLQAPMMDFGTRVNGADMWPLLHLAPNGTILHYGAVDQMHSINLAGSGSITPVGSASYGWYPKEATAIMYDEGKVLVSGGSVAINDGASVANAATVDMNGNSPIISSVDPMSFARQYSNEVMLPTGEVLVIGGNSSGRKFSDDGTILEAEAWDPTTETWATWNTMDVPRNYHSTALLLPDGRVFSGGGGYAAGNPDHPSTHTDAQLFSPPYLFNANGSLASRPSITSAPDQIFNGESFELRTSSRVDRFTAIRLSATTHTMNTGLRFLEFDFTAQGNNRYTLTPHQNTNVLVPGYWMLFALDANGVPSEAATIRVFPNSAPKINNPGIHYAMIDIALSLDLNAYDPLGNSITVRASNLPSSLSIHPNTGLISGTPGQADIGVYQVSVTVSNDSEETQVEFELHIIDKQSESGSRTVSQTDANEWHSVQFENVYANPVVIMGGATNNGDDPLTVRVRRVNPAGFQFQLDEWNYLDGAHASGETVSYLVVEAGEHRLPNGDTLWAGIEANVDHNFKSVAFPASFASTPIVLAQVGTVGGAAAVAPRLQNISSSSFQVKVQEEQGEDGIHAMEDIHWIALEPVTENGRFEADTTGVTVDERIDLIPFDQTYSNSPFFIGTFQTYTGSDPSALRYRNLDSDGVQVFLEEEQSSDNEVGHSNEALGYIVIDPANADNPLATINVNDLILNNIYHSPIEAGQSHSFTADYSGGSSPQFKWDFGDGTGESAYSRSASRSHTYAEPGRYLVTLTAQNGGSEESVQYVQAVYGSPTANRAVQSSPVIYQDIGNDGRIWNVNPDNDSVTAINATSGAKITEIPVGDQPSTLALGPDGDIWVVNARSATISIINSGNLAVDETLPLPRGSKPYGIIFEPNGSDGYVTLEQLGQVIRFNGNSRAQTGSLDVGQNARHLGLTGDGNRLYISRFISPPLPGEAGDSPSTNGGGGEVVVINTGNFSVADTVVLQVDTNIDFEAGARGVPNYLGAVAISPDGESGWVPSKEDNIYRGTLRDGEALTFDLTVRAIASYIDFGSNSENFAYRLDLDNASLSSAAAFGRYGSYLFVALETSNEVALVDSYNRSELLRVNTGLAPQGLVVSPDGLTLYVYNFMDRSVSMYDLDPLLNAGDISLPLLQTTDLVANEALSAQILLGKQLFYDGADDRLAMDNYMSCAACHADGGHDGRTWDLTGLGEGVRNTISLEGHGGPDHGRLHWTGNFDEVHDFEAQIRELAGGTGLMSDADFNATNDPLGAAKAGLSADLDAMAAYVNSLTSFGDSPYRASDGSLTADGQAGRDIFIAQNCASCHSGSAYTDSASGQLHDIGTLNSASGDRLGQTLTGLDTPTLRGLWATAPYLHDGSAGRLADAVNAHSGVTLSSSEMNQLVSFLQQIDDSEPAAAAATSAQLKYGVMTDITQTNGNQWHTVTFNGAFATTPIVVMGPPTYFGIDPSTVRVRNVTATGFEFQIDEWEYLDGGHPNAESIGWLAMEPGVHDLGGVTAVAASTSSTQVRAEVPYSSALDSRPVVLHQIVTTNETSAAVSRILDVSSSGFTLYIDEEEAADRVHATETVHYIALTEGQGSWDGRPFYVSITADSYDESWDPVDFGATLQNPVLLANIQTVAGGDPVALRYRNLSGSGVEFKVEEERSANNETGHSNETLGWVVFDQ